MEVEVNETEESSQPENANEDNNGKDFKILRLLYLGGTQTNQKKLTRGFYDRPSGYPSFESRLIAKYFFTHSKKFLPGVFKFISMGPMFYPSFTYFLI